MGQFKNGNIAINIYDQEKYQKHFKSGDIKAKKQNLKTKK